MKKASKTKKAHKVSEKGKKHLAKGQAIVKEAMKIMKKAGKKTIPAKTVYKMTMAQAMKKAAGK